MKIWLRDNRCGLILLLLAATLLLPFLGMCPLIDPDEPVYGETAREMLAAGDWLSPRIYGDFWYDKPPLFYWLEMISYSLFGISDYTSRLPSALLAMATVLYVYHQGKHIFTKEIAFYGSLVLLTSLGFIYIGKAAVTDMTLMLTLTVAMLSLYRKQYYIAYAFCGLALLAKGPIGYGFPALIMLCYIILCRHWQLLRTMKIPQGIALAFLVGLPWYILMYHAHGADFLDTFIGYHNITRFTAPEHPGQNRWYFFIPVLFAFMLPWSAAIVPAIHRMWKERTPHTDALRFCLIWAAFIFLFFSISQTQLVTYIAPMFPPTALIIGWYAHSCKTTGRRPILWIGTLVVLGCIFVGTNAIPLNDGAEVFKPVILWLSVLFAVVSFIPAWFLYSGRWRNALITIATAMLLFSASAFAVFLPTLAEQLSSREIAIALTRVYDNTTPLYVDKFLRPGLAFYSGIYGTEWNTLTHPDQPDGKACYLISKQTFKKLADLHPDLKDYPILAETEGQLIIATP